MLQQGHLPPYVHGPLSTPFNMKTSKKERKQHLTLTSVGEKLHTARQVLGIIPKTYNVFHKDAVFVAIDFENTQAFKFGPPPTDANYQVGIATLDTRNVDLSSPQEETISTCNLLVGSDAYEFGARAKYLFGEPSRIDAKDFLQGIKDCIPQDRNIFLVGHNIIAELNVLASIGFELQPGRLAGCFVTLEIARQIFGGQISLRNLLGHLKCPHRLLHNAGNDAHFTLRALLLLATRKCPVIEEGNERLAALEQLARSPIPSMSPSETLKAKKSAANRARKQASRKVQALSWSEEKKDEIRAERAAKRLREAGDDDLDDLELASSMFA